VVDVFTAVALSAILGRLLRRGAVIVATSNRAPSDLNKVCSCGNSKA
jgi:predicted ATPase